MERIKASRNAGIFPIVLPVRRHVSPQKSTPRLLVGVLRHADEYMSYFYADRLLTLSSEGRDQLHLTLSRHGKVGGAFGVSYQCCLASI